MKPAGMPPPGSAQHKDWPEAGNSLLCFQEWHPSVLALTGWVGHQPLLPLKGSQSPDVPGGQLQKACLSALGCYVWATEQEDMADWMGSRSRYPPERQASLPGLQLRSWLCRGPPEHQAH